MENQKAIVKDWIKAVRAANRYRGINLEFYVLNRKKAKALEKQLMSVNFDFSCDNLKRVASELF